MDGWGDSDSGKPGTPALVSLTSTQARGEAAAHRIAPPPTSPRGASLCALLTALPACVSRLSTSLLLHGCAPV